jgi:LPS sulfotransferase NodH
MASRVLYSNDDSSANLGAGVTQLFSHSANEHMKWRDETPDLEIIDIGYDELNRDAMNAIRRIYNYFGMPLSAASETAMQNWEANNRRNKHPANLYSSAAIGMTDQEIHKAFKKYVERFPELVN